ncbi:hypothetical protein SESBI_47854 [Sesbania bispinosa]|nr:hypothetical protein SESBI_47854 [Sesbania bispinosa]
MVRTRTSNNDEGTLTLQDLVQQMEQLRRKNERVQKENRRMQEQIAELQNARTKTETEGENGGDSSSSETYQPANHEQPRAVRNP